MDRKLARTLDRYLTSDPYDGTPADLGTDRPNVDPDAADAAARNERATKLAARPAPIQIPGEPRESWQYPA